MSPAYYNENDPKAAAWLRELIKAGLIAPGEVDDRSIEDVTPADLSGFQQCHFFAGIGGWSYALRLAGWPDERPVWTGSCPCQPFSIAGQKKGTDDERHLWPDWRWLIDQCRPAVVFGEQVASPAGRKWLAGVRTDLEAMGYGVGAADLCAAGVGAPHIRQRLYWMADTKGKRLNREQSSTKSTGWNGTKDGRATGWLGNPDNQGSQRRRLGSEQLHISEGRQDEERPSRLPGVSGWHGVYIPCGDGKARRIEPGLKPLVDGVPGRVGLLRGYGNAIVPAIAAEFIGATM